MSRAERPPVALVLAAGKGTRMKSRRPKVLFEVLGRPIVRRVVDAARAAGCGEVVVVVGYGADQVRAELADVDGLRFAVQRGIQGTGQAVAHAREALDWRGRTVLLLPGDVPLVRPDSLADLLSGADGAVTIATMRPPDPTGYGRIVRDGQGRVQRIVEQRDADEEQRAIGEVNTSIYAFDGDFLFGPGGAGGAIDDLTTDNEQGEYLLTDVVAAAASAGLGIGAVEIEAAQVAGINDRAQLAELERGLRRELNLRWMRDGVSMDEPSTVRIEEGVQLAQDVSLGVGVELRGPCRVGAGTRIGRGCVLTDVQVGDGVELGPYVVATGASIGDGATVLPFTVVRGVNEKRPHETVAADRVRVDRDARVGPFSHLRQSADLGPGVHVGNFVELKKTRMDDGAKANHLAYLGDARVGAGSNIGAGVITCNYDGVAKHRTTIGKGVFVGTDSHLIAPVKLGDGAYVATATTVTRDVPADALAVGRARQENKKGYASRIRAQLERRAALKQAREGLRTSEPAPGGSDAPDAEG